MHRGNAMPPVHGVDEMNIMDYLKCHGRQRWAGLKSDKGRYNAEVLTQWMICNPSVEILGMI